MHFITPSQCRAARALLNWSQQDLSEKSGVHGQTICGFEKQTTTPTKTTLEKITLTFENSGIILTKKGGVEPNKSDITTYKGRQGFIDFMDDVYETAKTYGGDIYLFNSRPKLWHDWLGQKWYDMHSVRMKALGDKINVKITVEEGDDFLILKSAQHKWFPKGLYKNKIFYAYGPKLAFLDFNKDSLKIIVVNQSEFSDIFRVLYDVAWENVAKDIPNN